MNGKLKYIDFSKLNEQFNVFKDIELYLWDWLLVKLIQIIINIKFICSNLHIN